MKISQAFPPNYKAIKAKLSPMANTVYTYGDTIYAPGIPYALAPDLLVHEETHEIQQGNDPAGWWETYLNDAEFRFKQELKAYQNQYKYFLKHNNRQEAFIFLDLLAQDLSGPIYGNVVSYKTALQLIKS